MPQIDKADLGLALFDKLAAGAYGELEAAKREQLAALRDEVAAAIADYEPSVVTRYILDLCAAFNGFYHDCPILTSENERERENRLALTAATRRVLGRALHLICMQTPEKI